MGIQTGCNDCDGCFILCILIKHGAKDNIGIISCQLLHISCSVVSLDQADVTGNIDNNVACAFDGCL